MTQASRQRVAIIGNQGFAMVNFRGSLIADMVDRGHRVFALAPDYDAGARAAIAALGAEPVDIVLERAGLDPLGDIKAWRALGATLRRLAPDTALAFAAKPIAYGLPAARRASVPNRFALVAGTGFAFASEPDAGLRSHLLRRTVRTLYAHGLGAAQRAFVQNPQDIEDLVSHRLCARDKLVRVAGTGVDLARWPPAPPVTAPMTFLLAARLLRDKGIGEFVAAARLVRARFPDARFVVLGGLDPNPNGFGRAEIEAWAAEGIITWHGHADVRPHLAAASVYVLPSYYREGVPRSIQEAMATARPIITTDLPGCRETVRDGQTGFLVPPRDSQALADAMLRFIKAPELVAAMGTESRALAEERFDARTINAQMMAEMGL